MDEYNRFNQWKILLYADRVKKILAGEFPPPVVMHIYPSNICPFKCSFCIMNKEKCDHPVKLSKKLLLRAVQDCIENDVKLIHFSGGGEPFTHPYLYEAISTANKGGVKVAISTNGKLMTNTKFIARCDSIRISVNAGTSEVHQNIHGTSNKVFKQILKNIKNFVNYRNSHKVACDIGMGFVITPENWMDIYNFCKIAEECGVDFVHIRPAYLSDKKKNEFLKAIIPSAFALAEKAKTEFKNLHTFSIKDKFDGYWSPRTYDKCRATPLQAVLTATGEFIVCQDVFIRFGDYNTKSFWKIWGSDEHRRALKKIDIVNCPRCVENKQNEIIQEVFIKDSIRRELL